MKVNTLFEHTAEIIKIVYNRTTPTDALLSDIFRKRKNYGSKERKFIANTLYFYFRNKLLIDYLVRNSKVDNVNSKEFPLLLSVITAVLLAFVFENDFYDYKPFEILKKVDKEFLLDDFLKNNYNLEYELLSEEIIELYTKLNSEIKTSSYQELIENKLDKLEILFSFPKLLLKKVIQQKKDKQELLDFLDNSRHQAPISIRVNTQKTNVDALKIAMQENDIFPRQSKVIPNSLLLEQRVQFSELNLYRQGLFEVQDEGSQLIGLFLEPQPNELIFDACAGAGGKSLHIAELQQDSGKVVANDIEYNRLKEIPKRAVRSGLKSIEVNLSISKSPHSALKEYGFDKVLVDAPCSGSGTIRRDPLKKFRINQRSLNKLAENQLRILENYAKYTSIGGILVYSTCSFLSDENINIANEFLSKNKDFVAVEITDFVTQHNISEYVNQISENALSIDFGKTSSDGFFMAKFRRIG